MIYSITIVTNQGVRIYKINNHCIGNNKVISKIIYTESTTNENTDTIYQVLDVDGNILAEIINCPVEVVYL